MENKSEGAYVPFPILDQLYSQKSVGPTPFSSEKLKNASYEPSAMVEVRDRKEESESGTFHYRMTYPAALPGSQLYNDMIQPSRSEGNFFCESSPAIKVPMGTRCLPAPNQYWQIPPAMYESTPSELAPKLLLPRDTLHPLLSALQASENSKAAEFNPAVAYLSCASRKGPPCESHQLVPKVQSQTNTSTLGDEGSFDAEADDDLGISRAPKAMKSSKRGDLKTAVGRAYNAEGGYHHYDQYSSKIIEFASSQPSSLTAIAAKALASAIHSNSHAIPANVIKDRHLKITPNSGPFGTNSNRYERAGVCDTSNVIIPPTPAFRNLSPDVKSALLKRTRDTRHRVAQILSDKYAPIQPPPFQVEAELSHLVEGEQLRQYDQLQRKHGREDDEEEMDYISDGDTDPIKAVGQSSSLAVWNMALKRKAARHQDVEDVCQQPYHPAKDVCVDRKLRVLTPQLVSVYNSISSQSQIGRYLGGNGIRMEDTLAQTKPPSQSSFLADGLKKQEATKQFSNIPFTPNNAFGFDASRFQMLLAEKGEEIEEIFLEGVAHIPEPELMSIGNFCPNLKLLNLANCTQVTDELLSHIFSRCQHLAYVNISGCTLVSGVALAVLFENCATLHVLCASGLPLLDKSSALAFSRLYHVKDLAVLDLSYCENLPDDVLVCVAESCRGLQILDISGCCDVSDTGVASIGSSCSLLRAWKLKLCSQLTDASLSLISLAPRNLRELDLTGIHSLTVKTFEAIVKHLPALRSLSIAGCKQLTDDAISAVTRYCRSLKKLNLSSCVEISLASCMELIHDLTQLRKLTVSESTISNAEVVMLSALRESCKIVRNQYRQVPVPKMVVYKPVETKKKAPAPKGKGKK